MRFSVYIERFGKLHRVHRVHRSSRGIYFLTSDAGNYTSYHQDGRFWHKERGKITQKRRRQPLDQFLGAETLVSSVSFLLAPVDSDPDINAVKVLPEDIIIRNAGNVGTEIILAEAEMSLTPHEGRTNSVSFIKRSALGPPVLIVEAFNLSDNVFPIGRFRAIAPQHIYLEDIPPRI